MPLRRTAAGISDGREWSAAYRARAAPPDLAGVLHSCWSGDPGRRYSMRLLPDGCADLVWDGGAVTVVPPLAGPRRVPVDPDRPATGLRLRCGALGGLLGVDARELGERPGPVAELLGRAGRLLDEELAAARDGEQVRELLLGWARGRLREQRTGTAPVAARLLARPGARVDEVADRLGIGPRRLHREVSADSGLAPKELARVLRFQRFAARLGELASGRRDLAGLAADAGYADQSHLGREVRRLSGSTPAELAGSWRRAGCRNVPDPGPAAGHRLRA